MLIPYQNQAYLAGFSDSQPSETIDGRIWPYIATSCIFAIDEQQRPLDVPVKKFDGYSLKRKTRAAEKLKEFVDQLSEDGIVLAGSASSHSQFNAAELGLRLVSELPDSEVFEHYEGYRLRFGKEFISLADASALMFYIFIVQFGLLRCAQKFDMGEKRLLLLMDNFPSEKLEPGQKSRQTKFVEYALSMTESGQGISRENSAEGITTAFDHLLSWQKSPSHPKLKGKKHPLFKLPDWASACANAVTFPDEFSAQFAKAEDAKKTLNAMENLWAAFKGHDIVTFDDRSINHIVAGETVLSIPEEAKEWVHNKAGKIGVAGG